MDNIEKKIMDDGFIYSDNIARKWIFVQTIRHNDFKRYIFNDYFIKNRSYKYEWKTTKNEIRVLSKISDATELNDRERFFNPTVIEQMLTHYKNTVIPHIQNPDAFCTTMSIVNELDKTLLNSSRNKRRYYSKLHDVLSNFCQYATIPETNEKSGAWIFAFKRSGAYYAMDSLIKYHNCHFSKNTTISDTFDSLATLEACANNKNSDLSADFLQFISQNANNPFVKNFIKT